MKSEEKVLKALANRRRLLIISFLLEREMASVTEIADVIRLSVRSTSKHLNILYRAGILDREQDHLYVYYYVADKPPSLAGTVINNL